MNVFSRFFYRVSIGVGNNSAVNFLSQHELQENGINNKLQSIYLVQSYSIYSAYCAIVFSGFLARSTAFIPEQHTGGIQATDGGTFCTFSSETIFKDNGLTYNCFWIVFTNSLGEE